MIEARGGRAKIPSIGMRAMTTLERPLLGHTDRWI